ncbi:MAG: hypothetical protein NC117_00490 [Pseudoflavonifractor sp.]|nr:hypothetical protein [Pseudoflavonifractor sp.]
MKRSYIPLAGLLLSGFATASAAPPIEYNAAVRDANGEVVAGLPVNFMLDIVDKPVSGSMLYSESHSAVTDNGGMACLMIGEGLSITGSYDGISWDTPRFLSVKVDVDGSGNYRQLSTMQLLGVPVSLRTATASSLVSRSSDGRMQELTVDNIGDLSWHEIGYTGEPAYDQSKVPSQLYFIGTFNTWDVTNALPMTKMTPTRFSIVRHLTPGEVFKFTSVKKWGPTDWSGTSSTVGKSAPLRELGNTPEFPGPEGDYLITVDFFNYTLTITPK